MNKLKPYRQVERELVSRVEDVPDFSQMSCEEEADWWETHDLADNLTEGGPEVDAEVYAALGIPDPAKSL